MPYNGTVRMGRGSERIRLSLSYRFDHFPDKTVGVFQQSLFAIGDGTGRRRTQPRCLCDSAVLCDFFVSVWRAGFDRATR